MRMPYHSMVYPCEMQLLVGRLDMRLVVGNVSPVNAKKTPSAAINGMQGLF